jgi:hypothetical protein
MRQSIRLVTAAALAAASASCGDVVRQGRAPVFLVIESLQGIRGGATGGEPSGTLTSDVITNVTTPEPCSTTNPCPTIFGDSGQAILRLTMKDIGTRANPNTPTTNNEVTITRYRVSYYRADGRNTPGVDVPYGFDGATTGTVPANGTLTLGFNLVRNTAKAESPLVQLQTNPSILATLADVTFFGSDRVGNEINVTGTILISFGNFGD